MYICYIVCVTMSCVCLMCCFYLKGIRPWWRHQMETFSALLAICAGNSPVPGEFPAQRPVTRSFDVFFELRLNEQSNKQSWGWRFETRSRSLWCHCNDEATTTTQVLEMRNLVQQMPTRIFLKVTHERQGANITDNSTVFSTACSG